MLHVVDVAAQLQDFYYGRRGYPIWQVRRIGCLRLENLELVYFGEGYYTIGYYDEAARFFRHVVELDPKNAGAHNGLGNVTYAQGRLDEAIAAYQRLTGSAPSLAFLGALC